MKVLIILGYSLIVAAYVSDLWGQRALAALGMLAALAVAIGAVLSRIVARHAVKRDAAASTDPTHTLKLLEDLKNRGLISQREFIRILRDVLNIR